MKTLRPFLEFYYATEGSFNIYFDFRPKNDYTPLSLEIHLFGRSIRLGIRHKDVEPLMTDINEINENPSKPSLLGNPSNHQPTKENGMSNEIKQDETQSEAIARHVFTALGVASVCWSELPTGVFDSTHAKKTGDDLIKFIESLTL